MNNLSYHKSTEILHVGTVRHRCYYVPFENASAALGKREQSGRFHLLNGEWKFLWLPCLEDAPEDFFGEDFPVSSLDTVQVPRCWQTYTERDYDKPLYSNLRYPFPTDPPHVPEENPCGIYFKDVELAKTQQRLYLSFEGVGSCFYLFVNGSFVGYSQISHSTSEFEITDFVREGKNRFCVAVVKWCDGTYLEDQDFFRLSGIFRDVYLTERPKKHVTDVEIRTELSDDLSSCRWSVDADEALGGKYTLLHRGKAVCAGEFSGFPLRFEWKAPVLWNAEQPEFCTLLLEFEDEVLPFTVGVCKKEIKDGVFLINGKRVVFAGINRHDSDPDTGYYVNYEQMENELFLLKQANVNAIRTSHYPNAPLFLELCTRLGFYLIDEADIETHGMGYDTEKDWDWTRWSLLSSSPEWQDAYVDRAASLYERDKNFPCVVMWSLGNESGAGVNHRAMNRYIKSRCPSAIVHYENSHKEFKVIPEGEDFSDISDVESRMYAGVGYIRDYLADKSNTKPFFMCEYVCSMSTGDVYDYFALADESERFCGGCIWEWCDHAINVPDADGNPRYLYGGDFGDTPNDGICCVDGLVFPDRTPRPGYYDMKKVYEPFVCSYENGVLTVKNKRAFASLSDLTVEWSVDADGNRLDGGKAELPVILPGESGTLRLTEQSFSDEDNCFMTVLFLRKEDGVWAEKGYEQGFAQFELGKRSKKIAQSDAKAQILEQTARTVTAVSGSLKIVFDLFHARLVSLCKDGKELLKEPARFDIWKAPNYNGGSAGAWLAEAFDAVTQKTYDAKVQETGDGIEITTRISLGSYSHPPILKADVRWTLAGGVLSVGGEVQVRKNAPCLPRFGLLLPLREEFEKVSYFGLTDRETYPDRYKSARFGRSDTTVDAMFVPYVRPQENGNRFATRVGEISDGETSLLFEEADGRDFCFSASHYSHADLIEAKHCFELKKSGFTYLHLDKKVNAVSENRELDKTEHSRIFGEKEFTFGFCLK